MQPVRLIQALPLPRCTIIHWSFLPGSSLLSLSPQAFQMLMVSINWKHIKIIESDHIVKYLNTYIPWRNTLTSSSSRSSIFIMQWMYMKWWIICHWGTRAHVWDLRRPGVYGRGCVVQHLDATIKLHLLLIRFWGSYQGRGVLVVNGPRIESVSSQCNRESATMPFKHYDSFGAFSGVMPSGASQNVDEDQPPWSHCQWGKIHDINGKKPTRGWHVGEDEACISASAACLSACCHAKIPLDFVLRYSPSLNHLSTQTSIVSTLLRCWESNGYDQKVSCNLHQP